MHITLRTGTQASKTFQVRIYINDAGPNRMLEVERAVLRCTCDAHTKDKGCRHVKECHPELRQWQTRQLRKLRREALGNATPAGLRARLEGKLQRDLQCATIIPLKDGSFALQWETSAAIRFAEGCGWGTGGQQAALITDGPEIAALHLLQKEPDALMWHWAIEKKLLYPAPVTALPPPVRPPSLQKLGGQASVGAGLFDLLDAAREHRDPQADNQAAWACFWAACCGLHLAPDDWVGRGRYLPAWRLGEESVAALAIDLLHLRVKGLTMAQLKRARAGMPERFHNQYAHVHKPWGVEHADSLGYQLIVCHTTGQSIRPQDNLLMLTTNTWAADGEMHGKTNVLLCQLAEVLLRMGHEVSSSLYHGQEAFQLQTLARQAAITAQSPAWEIPAEGWQLLQTEILPAVAAKQPLNAPALLAAFKGRDWAELVPPEDGSHR